jgi:hypothetical protein
MAVSLVDTLVSLARQNRTVSRAGQPGWVLAADWAQPWLEWPCI